MRLAWGVVVLLSCGTAATKECTAANCQGCCHQDTCYPGTSSEICGVEGQICRACPWDYYCTTSGGCAKHGTVGGGAGGGGGSAAGGGVGGGGGVAASTVFVTLKWGEPECTRCGMCDRIRPCIDTKTISSSEFSAMRTNEFAACSTSQSSSDGYLVTCTNCVVESCAGTIQNPTSGVTTRCVQVSGTSSGCAWNP